MLSGTSVALPRNDGEGSFWTFPGIVFFALAGLGLFWWQFLILWSLWTTDSLRSIGAAVIPCSIVLLYQSLRRQDFENQGSWLGLLLVAFALVAANLQYYGITALTFSHSQLGLIPIGLMLSLYAGGIVMLFGGAPALRKAGYALFLLLFVKPVPTYFTTWIDLPLQQIGANVARGFAALVGVSVSGPALSLMFFHNELGMFVAPACNGLRSATAMGLLALVIGALRKMPLIPYALFVVASVALAYAFNLLRLCALVLYYCLAHQLPILGRYAVAGDYVIGAIMFAFAAAFLFRAPRRWARR
jgi:exosortase J